MRESFTLPGTVAAPKQARRAVSTAAAGRVSRELLGRMILMTSEIVTNAFLHGGANDHSAIEINVEITRLAARVTVCDAGASPGPSMRTPDPGVRVGGFGLFLVDQLSDRWGVSRANGTCVFFELDLVDVERT